MVYTEGPATTGHLKTGFHQLIDKVSSTILEKLHKIGPTECLVMTSVK